MWKISLPPGFDPWTVQPVACRYTELSYRIFVVIVAVVVVIIIIIIIIVVEVFLSPTQPTR